MSKSQRRRYVPPAEVVKANRTAVRARARAMARIEKAEYRADMRAYRAGVLV